MVALSPGLRNVYAQLNTSTQSIMENLEQGKGNDVQTRDTAVAALRKIGELTSELVEIEEDHDQKSMNEATTECATVRSSSSCV
jgi:activator of HSP90 ATPase